MHLQERVKFSKWFAVKPLQKFHKVMTMEKFMKEKAPIIWKKGNRIGGFFASKRCVIPELCKLILEDNFTSQISNTYQTHFTSNGASIGGAQWVIAPLPLRKYSNFPLFWYLFRFPVVLLSLFV